MPKVSEGYLEARRQSIVEAARRAFARRGTQATTMAEIAAEAGITPGAIYRYFPTKEDLIEWCLEDGSAGISQRWDQPVDDAREPLEELAGLARATFGQLNHPDERTNTMIAFEHTLAIARENEPRAVRELCDVSAHIAGKVRARLDEAAARGASFEDLDTRLLAEALISFYWGARYTRLIDGEADTDGQLEQIFRVLRRAVARRD